MRYGYGPSCKSITVQKQVLIIWTQFVKLRIKKFKQKNNNQNFMFLNLGQQGSNL